MNTTGDLGDLTLYTNKNGKLVAFPKDWRQEKTSPARTRCRERFRLAQASWSTLDTSQKNQLEEACKKLSIPFTGQNLWISTALTGDLEAYSTVAVQSGINLPLAPEQIPLDV